MNFKNYRRIRMNSIRERIGRNIDKRGEFTIFGFLMISKTLSGYLSRLLASIKDESEVDEGFADLQRLDTLKEELETCLEYNKKTFGLIDELQKL